jgi:hypothetical protein
MDHLTRRGFLGWASLAGVGAIAARTNAAEIPAPETAPASVSDLFPTQSTALAREMVDVSHWNPSRVNELLKLHPSLANAAWDWGFGDWENALGAASHMGNVEIARALLTSGARPTIFSAAMLGQLAVVKAFVEASAGVQGTHGPHGITLLAHARAGGETAKPVFAYLTALGGADPVPKAAELPPELAARYAGIYSFGTRDTDRIEIVLEKGRMSFKRAGMMGRNLIHLGDHAFHPAGAPAVRIRFAIAADAAASEVAVFDPDLVLRAKRIA